MKRLLLSSAMAMLMVGSLASTTAAQSSEVCGPEGGEYRCGAVLVILTADTADSIGDVVERMGGDPDADVLQEFVAVRDLLNPDGVADDTSEATVYQIAVPVGQEEASASAYAADPAVYAASVDRETIGTTTPPDTALPSVSVAWTMVVGLLLLIASGAEAARSLRR